MAQIYFLSSVFVHDVNIVVTAMVFTTSSNSSTLHGKIIHLLDDV